MNNTQMENLRNGGMIMRRMSYYASESFWIADNTEANKKLLIENNISFNIHNFIAADGTRGNRLEF